MTRRVGRDVLVAGVGFWVILSVVYAVGRHLIPSSEIIAVLATSVRVDQDGNESMLFDLRTDLLAVGYSTESGAQGAAVAQVSGAVEDRLLLDHVDRTSVSLDEDEQIHLAATYRGARGVLLVAASGLTVGLSTSEQVSVTLTADGKTFIGTGGACIMELSRFESDTSRGWEWAGHVTCTDVPEIRSEATASFTVVFEYEIVDP
ncbi:MAG: hypothetical protein WEE36_04010 [Acidimicrobiia bacterium]